MTKPTNDKPLENELRPTLKTSSPWNADDERLCSSPDVQKAMGDILLSHTLGLAARANDEGNPFVTPRTMADIVDSLTKLRAKTNREIDRDVEESLARDGVVTPAAKKAAHRQALLDREVERMSRRLKRRLKRKHGIVLAGVECRLSILEKR